MKKFKTASVKLPIEYYNIFKKMCDQKNVTINKVLKMVIMMIINNEVE